MSQLPMFERIVQGRLLIVGTLDEGKGRPVGDGDRNVIFLTLVSVKPLA